MAITSVSLFSILTIVALAHNVGSTTSGEKQDKLIGILHNLQLSIAEILKTLNPEDSSPSSGSGKTSTDTSPRAGRGPVHNGPRVDPFSQTKDRTDSGRSLDDSKEMEPDTPPSSSVGSSSGVRPGPGGGGDSVPSGRPMGSSGSPKPSSGPGRQFRCAATYAGTYGHEYEKPSLHHVTHHGVSENNDFTPHMIEARWSSGQGWDPAHIVPHQNISMYPSSKVLMHGQQVFDTLQAIMGFDNRIRLFRPNLHLERFRRSAARLGLPDLDATELTICLKRLILTDASFLPPSYSNGSLEIRTVMMGIDDQMMVKPGQDVLLYVYMNRHTTLTLEDISKPKSVYSDSQYVRSWLGGLGDHMTSANYAGTLMPTQIAHQQGYGDVLWLHSKEEHVTSLNIANVFVFIVNDIGKRELITPPLNGLIVPGVIRQTILEMTRHWNEFDVTERSISIHELRTLRRQGRLMEMFSSDTMANVVPIVSVYYAPIRTLVRIPTLDQRDPLYLRLNRAIHAIEYGLIVHPWGEIV